MKRASVLFFCFLFVCLMAAPVQAGGFGLYEWGNRSLGMGTSNYAVGNDASVVAYNPALMTQFDDIQTMAGFAVVSPSSDVNITKASGAVVTGSTGDFSTKDQSFVVPHAYAVGPYSENVSLGIGVFTRYGLGTKYSDDWGGATMLQEILLESYSVQPTVAFKVTDKFSIGAGPEFIRGEMKLKKALPTLAGSGTATVKVDGLSVGGVLGAHYQFDDNWSLGFTYRSPVEFTGTGDLDIGGNGGGLDGNHDAKVRATFPSSFTLGLGYEEEQKWALETSVIWTRWEEFDYMTFDYSLDALDNEEEFYYKNTWRFQLGGEYNLTEMMALRAGFVYDQTPTRHDYASVMLPANDRMLYSLGLGFKGSRWHCDLSGMYITTKGRSNMSKTVSNDATYEFDFDNGQTWVFGISGGYAF